MHPVAQTSNTMAGTLMMSNMQALGRTLRNLREDRHLSRAELLDLLYTELEKAGIDYKVKGDWWLNAIESGEKAKQLSRDYIHAFIRALQCTKLEAIHLLLLADLNVLANSTNNHYVNGLTYVLLEIYSEALTIAVARIDAETASRLNEREWLVVGKAILELVINDLEGRVVE